VGPPFTFGGETVYIANQRSWATSGGQWATGAFLMLFSKVVGGEIRAAVRHVKMGQTGQWMMANVRLYGQDITLSGTYGEDGLTMDVKEGQEEMWRKLTPLPAALAQLVWTDGSGHNSAGSVSGPKVAEWAREHIKALRKPYEGVNTNDEQGLYVIPSVSLKGRVNGYSCLGYEVAERKIRRMLAWLGRESLDSLANEKVMAPGTVAHYNLYRRVCEHVQQEVNRTGRKCEIDLEPQLKGLEGKVVRVLDSHDEARVFRVGKSTGWIPCHLEIGPKESGGPAVTGAPYKSVRVLHGRELLAWERGEEVGRD
jgi:hypothetical protein